MLDIFNFPTPQGSNYQEFYGGNTAKDWVKPRGASMVRFMLIGPGGGGYYGTTSAGGSGGGSGAVTSWIGPAIFIPDVLHITVGKGGTVGSVGTYTYVSYQAKDGNGYTLLYAANGDNAGSAASSGNGGAAMANNYFGASGIFTSIAGQDGVGVQTSVTASTTTFLSGGAGGSGSSGTVGGGVTPNYGYTPLPTTTAGGTVKGADGYFIKQPILVGTGGCGGTTSTTFGTIGGNGGIGCGGGGAGEDYTSGGSSKGGDGAVFIWAW